VAKATSKSSSQPVSKRPASAAGTQAPQVESTTEFHVGLEDHPADTSRPYLVMVAIATLLLIAAIAYWVVQS